MRPLLGLAWAVLLGLALALSPQGGLQGPLQVVRVVDGDTVELAGVGAVRLIGIDAPESGYNRRTSGPEEVRLGLEAKAFLTRLLQGKRVWVELDVQERDRYRRVLAYLYLEDPKGDWTYGARRFRQVNLEVVRAGWAEPYTVPPNVRYADLYLQAAREARAVGAGFYAAGKAATLREGVRLAQEVLASGEAYGLLERYVAFLRG
ncbi:nuclease [Thermus scotoductus]|uniref:Nuclease n=1 Tax=Thermus scotoductus TaxID=37636 RepID=A0A430SCM4_THESC|nr:thermonuclease family protein [Thermus scotoductus]RTH34104.1 nuclease [Thermus scotoductus]